MSPHSHCSSSSVQTCLPLHQCSPLGWVRRPLRWPVLHVSIRPDIWHVSVPSCSSPRSPTEGDGELSILFISVWMCLIFQVNLCYFVSFCFVSTLFLLALILCCKIKLQFIILLFCVFFSWVSHDLLMKFASFVFPPVTFTPHLIDWLLFLRNNTVLLCSYNTTVLF